MTAFYAVASVGAGRSPPETSTPFRGERVPVGGRSPVENSAVASDIAERAPLGHSNRSDPFSFVNSVVAGRVPPAHSNRADRRESQGFMENIIYRCPCGRVRNHFPAPSRGTNGRGVSPLNYHFIALPFLAPCICRPALKKARCSFLLQRALFQIHSSYASAFFPGLGNKEHQYGEKLQTSRQHVEGKKIGRAHV